MLTLSLPYPPSINDYYGVNTSTMGRYLKPRGKAYRRAVVGLVAGAGLAGRFAAGALAVRVVLNPAEGQTEPDVDNGNKALLDALTHAGVWSDDRQARALLNEYGEPVPGGSVTVFIGELSKTRITFEFEG